MSTTYTLYRLAEFGAFVVYARGTWAKRESVPRYLVSNQDTGRDLKEFRRLKTAKAWAMAQDTNPMAHDHIVANFKSGVQS